MHPVTLHQSGYSRTAVLGVWYKFVICGETRARSVQNPSEIIRLGRRTLVPCTQRNSSSPRQ